MSVKVLGVSALDKLRRTPPWRIDAVLATCFVVTGLTTTNQTSPAYEPRDGLAIFLILAATVPYYFRRLAPLPVLAVSITAVAAVFVGRYAAGTLPMVVAVGAYTVAAQRPLREVVLAAAYMNLAFVVMLLGDSPDFGGAEFATSVAVFGATMLVGWSARSRRLRLDAIEREQGEAALRAVADERLRIAQELHDVVAHSMGLIAVQAGVGMHVIDSDPAEARRALEHISRTSRSSLAEIRRALGLVRSGAAGAAHAPAPGLADLPRLVEETEGAGVSVDLAAPSGGADLDAVPAGVGLAAYRIVQEALTNSLRHGHARHARVQVDLAGGRLRVVVTDDGSGPNGAGRPGGHGLVGMRERVAVYGGTLEVGPGTDGGFRVEATLLYDEDQPE